MGRKAEIRKWTGVPADKRVCFVYPSFLVAVVSNQGFQSRVSIPVLVQEGEEKRMSDAVGKLTVATICDIARILGLEVSGSKGLLLCS